MLPVYSAYFGLKEAPFNITPDPGFLFASASHREGLAQLRYGIEARRGFIVLTGEVGTGKTTLIQALLRELGTATHTALIFSAITSPIDLLRYVNEEFGIIGAMQGNRDAHDYVCLLNEFLLQKYREGRNAALIIDEAQNLTPEVLESVRLLSNFETTKDKLLQILLVGQPELNERLNAPQIRQLKQRVALRHQLRPLSLSECREYIHFRLTVAGATPQLFLPTATEAVHRYSGGIPRLINVVCDNAMICAFALDKRAIEPRFIEEVAADLCLSNTLPETPQYIRNAPLLREVSESFRSDARPAPTVHSEIGSSARSHETQPAREISTDTVPERVLICVRDLLIDAIGPMGKIILSEQVRNFGASMDCFPRDKIVSLIDSVSQEISDEFRRSEFRRWMSKDVRSLQ